MSISDFASEQLRRFGEAACAAGAPADYARAVVVDRMRAEIGKSIPTVLRETLSEIRLFPGRFGPLVVDGRVVCPECLCWAVAHEADGCHSPSVSGRVECLCTIPGSAIPKP